MKFYINCIILLMAFTLARKQVFNITLSLSALFSYLLITNNYFPQTGIAIIFIIFALLGYIIKNNKSKNTLIYLSFTLIFAFFIIIRSNPLITFLNICASLFFGSLMLTSTKDNEYGMLDYILIPIQLIIKSFFTPSGYFPSLPSDFKTLSNRANTLVGILITFLVLIIVIPLLSSANPLFSQLVERLMKMFSLENLLNNFNFPNIFIWLIRSVFFFGFLFILPRILNCSNNVKYESVSYLNQLSLPLRFPKITLLVVLFVFTLTQLQIYFATPEKLQELGLTHSSVAREIFAQLSITALVVLTLLYNTAKNSKDKLVDWLLGLEGVFLTLMAYKSALEYINAWGLTYARLYGLTVATLVLGVLILFFENYIKNAPKHLFIKRGIIFSAIILILVNLLNYDYLIYNFKKATTGKGPDYTYLSGLSADSLSYKDQLIKLENAIKNRNYSEYDNLNPYRIIVNVSYLKEKYLKEKYKNFDLRTFSLMEYVQYLDIKDVNTDSLMLSVEHYMASRADMR